MNQVSLVEQLKELLKAQNASLRVKHDELKTLREENSRLTGLVQELEIENEGLKGLLSKYPTDNANGAAENGQINSGTSRPSTLAVSSPNTTESELYTTALSSPESKGTALHDQSQVTITLSSTPNSTCLSPKKAAFGRGESRKKNRKSYYELSPDISDKNVQLLEKNYGGKERANRAARIIQQHYRSWAMKRTYFRLRTQSEARRTSMKGYLSKRGSLQSPNSSGGSLSPNAVPIPLNLSLNISESENSNELALKAPELENRQRRNSAKDEFKPIQADINIDSNFGHVDTGQPDLGQPDLSVRRVSEDIASIEISKNLLNDSIGQKMIIDEVFQQILSPRKDSISLPGRSNSFRSKMSIVEESVEVTETLVAPKNTITAQGDGANAENDVDGAAQVDEPEKVEVDGCEKVEVDSIEKKISAETVQEEMMVNERPAEDDAITMSSDSLSVKEDQGKLRGSYDSFDIDESYSHSWPALDQLSHIDDTTSLSGSSLSPSSSIMQTFYEDKEKDVRIGINHFNRKPKKGIKYLIETGVLDEFDAGGICRFLREEPGINKQKIGEYLGDLRNPLSMDVLQLFVRTIPMEGKEIDEALRLFQTFFRMPGEAQKIERLVEEFSTAYVDANPDKVSGNSDTVLVLAFAIIMLNTDLHSPNVKRKMSKEQFTRNLRGTDDGEDLPADLLSAIYDRVEKKQFKTGPDNLDAIYKYEKQILGKVPWTTLALPHRQLRQVTTLYEIQHGGKKKEKPHHRVVFLFNDMVVITKERGQAGQKGIHYYSYKSSYQLCDIKFQLFNNNYYKYGLRIINKVSGEVHIVFHAKKEDIRKAFYTELRDCIEETNVMENERISDEKTRQLAGTRHDLEDTISLSLPHFGSQRKKNLAPDSLSLVNEPGILTQGTLTKNNPLSSSLQDFNQTDDGFYEDNLQKSTSIASFEYTGRESSYRASISSEFSFSNGSMQNIPRRFGLFSSKRSKSQSERKLTKSTGSLEEIKTMRRKTSTASDQRKSEFFVTSPIAT